MIDFYYKASSCENNFFSKSFTIFLDDDGRYFYLGSSADISLIVLFPIDGNFSTYLGI